MEDIRTCNIGCCLARQTKFKFASSIIMFVVLIIFFITACDNEFSANEFTKIEEVRSPLALDLVSYMNKEEVFKKLSITSENFVPVEHSHSGGKDSVPPFQIFTIELKKVEINNYEGKARISFFNNRLMEVRFFPENFARYLKSTELLGASEETFLKPYTKIWVYEEEGGFSDRYIGWIDVRLEEQFSAWVKYYS